MEHICSSSELKALYQTYGPIIKQFLECKTCIMGHMSNTLHSPEEYKAIYTPVLQPCEEEQYFIFSNGLHCYKTGL